MSKVIGRIFDTEPATWQELEEMTAQAFDEMGYESKPRHQMQTVRGQVVVDVCAVKHSTPIPTAVLVECKYWNKGVDQGVVYAFRSICADAGAHFGLIISKVGFQSGAGETRAATNIHLLDFFQFQETFYQEWRQGIFMRFSRMCDELLPIMPGNPNYLSDKTLQSKLQGLNLFEKYDVFFGSQRYTSFFIENGAFPISMTDSRGDPRKMKTITVKSPRQYFEVSVQGWRDARDYFGI